MPADLIRPLLPVQDAEQRRESEWVLTGARNLEVRPRVATFTSLDPVASAALLDYAAFVLDQEAKYCQQ